jgi:hypothetical protein
LSDKENKTKIETLSLSEYLNLVKIHEGLLASYFVESKIDKDERKTKEEWDKEFENQSKKIY